MSDELNRRKRVNKFMNHPMPESSAKYYLYPNPELLIEDAIELVDRIADTHEQTTWQLTRITEKMYIGTIKSVGDSIGQLGLTPAQALTFAADEFIKNIKEDSS